MTKGKGDFLQGKKDFPGQLELFNSHIPFINRSDVSKYQPN